MSNSNSLEPSNDSDFTDVINHRLHKRHAITSYAVICCTEINKEVHYLIAKTRDSIPFKEFIRANISETDMARYLNQVSRKEKYRLLTETHQELVNDVIINHNSRAYKAACAVRDDFEAARLKYRQLLLDPHSGLPDLPWGFPKGRKNDEQEEDDICALREFEEETHIKAELLTLQDRDPIEEIYVGLDGRLYKTVYFIATINYQDYLDLRELICQQFVQTHYRKTLSDEISCMRWLKYEQASNKLDNSKQYVLRLADIWFQLQKQQPTVDRRHSF